MESLALLFPVLGCAAMMGGMMWMMGRGKGKGSAEEPSERQREINRLRKDIADLRQERDRQPTDG